MAKCKFIGCKTHACFNNEGETIGLYCAKHKEEGMVDIKHKRCAFKDCKTRPNFNEEGESEGLYCAKHRKNGMVDVKHKRCEFKDCNTRPTFNVEGETDGLYCAKHIKEGMVDVINRRCAFKDCKTIPIFNEEGEPDGLFCAKHRKEGMVDVVSNRCAFEDCTTRPTFNEEGESEALYCAKHREEGMIDVKSKRCAFEDCKTQPTFNEEGETGGLYCAEHKKEGMIDVRNKSKKCVYKNCETRASFNNEGKSNALYCSEHKLKGMINVFAVRCKTPLCDIIGNPKYDGYCIRCYMYMFPDKPVARNYKTKECCVDDFLFGEFPNYKWIFDKASGSSKKRPDAMVDLVSYVIIIEIDENQHADYDCTCENKRIMQISQDLGHAPIVFIRFNPDDYIDKDGNNISSCWHTNAKGLTVVNKKKQKEWHDRLDVLKETVKYWIDNKLEKTIEVIQLFYDQN